MVKEENIQKIIFIDIMKKTIENIKLIIERIKTIIIKQKIIYKWFFGIDFIILISDSSFSSEISLVFMIISLIVYF